MRQPSPDMLDCIVVGGGAAGLASAIGLARAGLATRIVGVPERARDDGRSAALFNSSLDFLDRLGIGEALRRRGAPLAAIRLIDVTGALVRAPTVTFKAAEIGQELFGWNIPNAAIVEEMIGAAQATTNLEVSPAFLEALMQRDDHVEVRLVGGEVLRARLVIGADGQNSRVRSAAGIGHRDKPYPQAALTCRLRHPRDHEDISREFHTREGPFTLVPVGDFASALVWVGKPARIADLVGLPREDLARAITRASHAVLGEVTVDGPVASVPLRKLIADRLVEGRVALVGEAGHAFPPIGAQGLNLGLKDVESLVKFVGRAFAAGEDCGGACLTEYARNRRMDVSLRTAGVDLLNTALIADTLPTDLARAFGLAALRDFGPLRRLAMRVGGWGDVLGRRMA